MIRSSPGGLALQDYHWSGGIYSNNFANPNRFADKNKHFYGPFEGTLIPDVPDVPDSHRGDYVHDYTNLKTDFPTKVTNPIFKEEFTAPSGNVIYIFSFILFLLGLFLIYMLDKTFGVEISKLSLTSKFIILFVTVVLFIIGIVYGYFNF